LTVTEDQANKIIDLLEKQLEILEFIRSATVDVANNTCN
jgi:acetolactate synthase small subunit